MADKRLLTDRYLRALAPAPRGERVEIWDSRVPGFGIRVSDTKDADPARRGKAGRVSFMLYARFAGAAPTRRTIGTYGAITLDKARRTAGEWRSLIDKGVDPAQVEAEAHAAEARERAARIRHSFGTVAEAFIADKLAHERRGKNAERYLRTNFAAWQDRPISQITTLDVLEVINKKKRTAPQMARALLVIIRRFFNWCIDQHVYGLTASPCDRLKIDRVIGPEQSRSRRLTDEELFALGRATARMKYPIGSLYRMLLLTGLRLNECAALSWPEINHDTITIPPTRMKGRNGTAREHLVPLTQAMRDVIATVPRYRGAPFLFLVRCRQASAGDHRPHQIRFGQAHGADPESDGPPSRRGSSRRHAAGVGHARFAPRRALRSVATPRPGQRRGKRLGARAARHHRRL